MAQTEEERKAKRKEQSREYYQKNKEKLKADSKKRYLKDHEKNIQYRKDWYSKNRERELERRKEYHETHRDEMLTKGKKRYEENKEKYKKMGKEYREKNKEQVNKQKREHYQVSGKIKQQQNKKIIVEYYSEGRNCCNCPSCNESNIEFLAIDHIEGGGGKHRKQVSGNFYNYLIKEDFPEGYQILCHNCNVAKRDKGYCPVHERKFREETFAVMEEQSSFEV